MKKQSRVLGGLRYDVCCEASMEDMVPVLFGFLEGLPHARMRDGFRLEMGFSVFTFRRRRGGYQLRCPDYRGDPLGKTTEDLTLALWIMLSQTRLLQRCGLSPTPCRYDEPVAVARGALEQPLVSLRRMPELGGSGWCLDALRQNEAGELEPVPGAEYEALRAGELPRLRPGLVQALLCPRGCLAVFRGEELVELLNEEDESLLPEAPADCSPSIMETSE